MTFSGSYAPDDVTFLLKPVELAPTPVVEKERLIQSGQRHYSEMIGPEPPPDDEYLELFGQAFAMNGRRLARDIVCLARSLAQRAAGEVVLVSLARAGTPIGVLLRRVLLRLGTPAPHYSISIIRDRGIDTAALDYVVGRHRPQDVVFVDGWTGKGAIAGQLRRSLDEYSATRGIRLDSGLTVVADLAGVARLAATHDDYLVPCSILNAVISGLVSRTILAAGGVAPGDYHACVYYRELAPLDRSRWFVDALEADLDLALADPACEAAVWTPAIRRRLKQQSDAAVKECAERYRLSDPNRIKPGIGESTRALLRRVPERLLLRDPLAEDVRHLVHLARRKDVTIDHEPQLPYRALAIIRTLGA